MNTTSYMDKQVMDLSKGSSTQSKDFIDLMNHPEEEEDGQSGHGGTGNGIDKKEEIFPSYDFQPIRPVAGLGGSPQSPNFDLTHNLGGSARSWNSSESKPKSAAPFRVTTATTLTLFLSLHFFYIMCVLGLAWSLKCIFSWGIRFFSLIICIQMVLIL